MQNLKTWRFNHVFRESNKADKLVNQAIDAALDK